MRRLGSHLNQLAKSSGPRSALLVTLTAAASFSPGCLVTEHLQFGEANFPAILTPVTPGPISFARFMADPACPTMPMNDDDEEEEDASVTLPALTMRFEVSVADVNIDDELQARVLVNGDPAAFPEVGGAGKFQRGIVIGCVDASRLTAKCSHVVFAVTREWKDGADPLAVKEPGDLAKVSFLVLGKASDNSDADAADCEQAVADAGPS